MKRKDILTKISCFIVTLSLWLCAQPLLTDTAATYEYKSEKFKLGLYEGSNAMPAEHLAKGLKVAEELRKMSKVNIVPIGHSVPYTTFNGWNWSSARTEFKLASNTEFVNATISAQMAWDWINKVKSGGKLANLANSDVHVLVVQLTWAPFFGPDDYEKNTSLSQKIDSMSHDFGRLAANAKKNYPNLKMVLFQADPWQNDHEPYHAYHEWLFARQVVLDQINKASDYTGPAEDDLWIGLGGYWWKPNADKGYYTDCCHISGSGATYYRSAWVKSLLETNPVVAQFLLQDPPDIPVPVSSERISLSSADKINCTFNKNGVSVGFSLPASGSVNTGLFSVDGRTIIPMTEHLCSKGYNTIQLETQRTLKPGAYIVRLDNGITVQSINVTAVSR